MARRYISAVGRHAAAWVASAAAVSVLPGLVAELSWQLSDWMGQPGGLSYYVRGWRSSELQTVGPSGLMNPLSPGPLLLLATTCIAGILGERGLRKHPWLRWALPAIPAAGLGCIVTAGVALALPPDFSRSVPIVAGVGTCVGVGIVATVYWGVLRVLERAAG
jgi:hypothetical protein